MAQASSKVTDLDEHRRRRLPGVRTQEELARDTHQKVHVDHAYDYAHWQCPSIMCDIEAFRSHAQATSAACPVCGTVGVNGVLRVEGERYED